MAATELPKREGNFETASNNGAVAELKTRPTEASVDGFVDAIPNRARREDCRDLLGMMQAAASEAPRMWGSSIVGFGRYDYRYASGRSGTWFRVGFSPRKTAISLYLMLDLDAQEDRLAALGKHQRGKSCLYVRRLADIDTDVLRELIEASCCVGVEKSCGGPH